MLEGSSKAAAVSQLNPSPRSNIYQNASVLIIKKLYDVYTWILVARNSAEIIKVQPKQQTRQYSVLMERRLVENSSWVPSSFILFTLLRSLHLLGATCQNINSAVVFFPSSPSFSVLLSPSLPRCEKPFQSVLLSL